MPPSVPPEDDPGSLVEDDLLHEGLDPRLFDPDAWPDDDEDPTTARVLAELEAGLTVPPAPLPLVDDEDGTDLPSLLDDDLLDTQHDVDYRVESAAEEALPILPLALEVEVDGRRVPARVDLALDRSRLTDPSAPDTGLRDVQFRIRGRSLSGTVQVVPGPEPRLALGLDVLRSRFLLRP